MIMTIISKLIRDYSTIINQVKLLTSMLFLLIFSGCFIRGKIIVDAASELHSNNNLVGPHLTTILLSGSIPATTNPLTVNAIFNESITGLAISSFQVTNGNVTAVSGSGTTYSLTIVPTTDGLVSITLLADKVSNSGGEKNVVSIPYTFTYTSSTVVALLTQLPTLTSSDSALHVIVGGTNVDEYRYKIGPSSTTDCTSAAGYSAYTSISGNISDDLTSFDDGLLKLCVQGRDSVAVIVQPLSAISEYVWTSNAPAKLEFTTSSQLIAEDDTNPIVISWKLDHKKSTDVTFEFNYTGTAIYALDHNLLPGSVTIPAGQLSQSKTLSALGNITTAADTYLRLSVTGIDSANAILGDRKVSMIVFRDNDSGPLKTIQTFAYNNENSCILYTNMDLYCWGQNLNGELNDGTKVRSINPKLVGTGYIKVAMGRDHLCAIKSNGDLYCWGDNSYGQLGRGNTTPSIVPILIDSGVAYTQISAGKRHTCGITSGKKLKCWGANSSSQLGDGSATQRNGPTAIDAANDYIYVSAGAVHTCGIRDVSNLLLCWGNNDDGQLGDGNTAAFRNTPYSIDPSEQYKYVSANGFGGCAITLSDDLKCWGGNYVGEVGVPSTDNSSIPILVDAGEKYAQVAMANETFDYSPHTCGVTLTGVGKCWGGDSGYGALGQGSTFANYSNSYSPLIVDAGISYRDIQVNAHSSCGVTSAGELKCWGFTGSNYIGNSIIIETPKIVLNQKTFKSVAVSDTLCAIDTSNYLYCTHGYHDSNFIKIDGSNTYSSVSKFCALRTDGTMMCSLDSVPTEMLPGTKFKYFSSGDFETYCGIDTNDDLYCWGRNFAGQVGNNSTVNVAAPVIIDAGTKYKFVINGHTGTCGITMANKAKCWGEGILIGDGGDLANNLIPTPVNDSADYSYLTVGSLNTCGITTIGKLKCWGYETSGQLGNGNSTTNPVMSPVAIDSGNNYLNVFSGNAGSCAVDSNHKLKCWGDNSSYAGNGVLGTGSLVIEYTTPTAVDASEDYQVVSSYHDRFCGITVSGILKCWGLDQSEPGYSKYPFSFEQYFPIHTINYRHP